MIILCVIIVLWKQGIHLSIRFVPRIAPAQGCRKHLIHEGARTIGPTAMHPTLARHAGRTKYVHVFLAFIDFYVGAKHRRFFGFYAEFDRFSQIFAKLLTNNDDLSQIARRRRTFLEFWTGNAHSVTGFGIFFFFTLGDKFSFGG